MTARAYAGGREHVGCGPNLNNRRSWGFWMIGGGEKVGGGGGGWHVELQVLVSDLRGKGE
jgi:hypothetical protein